MELIAARLGVRVKYDRPGSLQRLLRAYQSPVDVREAERAGRAAVRLAVRGRTGVMAALQAERDPRYRSWLTPVPLELIANRERPMPAPFLAAPDAYPNAAFREYAAPLIGRVEVEGEPAYIAQLRLPRFSVKQTGDAP
jgi:6-phosphofructokinase 1